MLKKSLLSPKNKINNFAKNIHLRFVIIMKRVNWSQLHELDIKLCTGVSGDFICNDDYSRNEPIPDAAEKITQMSSNEQSSDYLSASTSESAERKGSTSIAANNKRLLTNLRSLNLNQCIKFKEERLLALVNASPSLRELSVCSIASVSGRLVDTLLERKHLLSSLDISFCPNLNESDAERYEQFLYDEFGSREFSLDKRFISK